MSLVRFLGTLKIVLFGHSNIVILCSLLPRTNGRKAGARSVAEDEGGGSTLLKNIQQLHVK